MYVYDGSDFQRLAGDTSGNAKVIGPVAHDAADTGKNPVKTGGVYDATLAAVTDGDVADHHVDKYGRVLTNDGWVPSLQAEESADDSDKTFTVPASTLWRLQSIWVELATTADVGNRQLEVQFQDDSSDVIGEIRVGVTQAASLTYYYMLSNNLADLTAVRDTGWLMTPLPILTLPAGYKIRIYDNAAIAAAADDMVCQVFVEAKTV